MKSRTRDAAAPGPFVAPCTKDEYDRVVAYLNTMVDEIADDSANLRYQRECAPLLTRSSRVNRLSQCGVLRITVIQPQSTMQMRPVRRPENYCDSAVIDNPVWLAHNCLPPK